MEEMVPERRVSEIQHNSESAAIQVRVLNKWKPYHTKTAMTYLMIDKYGGAIQAMFEQDEEVHLDKKIEVMKAYTLNNYSCSYGPTFNRVALHSASLKINRDLSAEPLANDADIPTMYFNFLPYEQLPPRLLRNETLTDYIGKVEDLEHVETANDNSVLRMKLKDTRGNIIMVALWKKIHSKLNLEAITNVDHEVIVAITALKVVPYLGGLQLQSTNGTKVEIEPHIAIAKEMSDKLKDDRMGTPIKKITAPKLRFTERMSDIGRTKIVHLHQQDSETLKQQTFTVEATITEFTKARAWFFVTCKQCSSRIREHNFTYSCIEHKQQHLSYSYSVNCNIEDHTGSANVTVFDKGILTMLGIRCYDMLTKENSSESRILPKPIEAQRGSKWIFQIKNGARYGNSVIKFTANNVFPAPITTPPTLTAPTGEENLKLYITGGGNSTTKRQLFKNEGNEGPTDKKLKAKEEA